MPRSRRGWARWRQTWCAITSCSAEARERGAGLVVFPELGLTGYQLQDLAAEVAMRLDDPRLAELAAATGGCRRSSRSSRNRPTTACSSRPACSRTASCGTFIASCSCPPTACSTSAASSPQATACVPCRPARGRHRHRHLRGLLAPDGAAAAGARWRPDPDQRVVVAGPRPGGDQRGRPRHGDLVAHADAHVRAADDLVRRLLQSGRGRGVDLVLGWLGGDRAVRPGDLQRPALRRGPVRRRRGPRGRPARTDRPAAAA